MQATISTTRSGTFSGAQRPAPRAATIARFNKVPAHPAPPATPEQEEKVQHVKDVLKKEHEHHGQGHMLLYSCSGR